MRKIIAALCLISFFFTLTGCQRVFSSVSSSAPDSSLSSAMPSSDSTPASESPASSAPLERTFPAPTNTPLKTVHSTTPMLHPLWRNSGDSFSFVGFLDQNFQVLIEPRYLSCIPAYDEDDETQIKYYAATRPDGWVDVLDLTGKVLKSYEGALYDLNYYVDYATYIGNLDNSLSPHDGVVYIDEGNTTTVMTSSHTFTLPFRFSAQEKLTNGFFIGYTYSQNESSYFFQYVIISEVGEILVRSSKSIIVHDQYIWLTKGTIQGYVDFDGNWYYREPAHQMLED